MAKKVGTTIYYDWIDPISDIPPEEFKPYILAVLDYERGAISEIPQFKSKEARMASKFMFPQIDRAKKNSINGSKGGSITQSKKIALTDGLTDGCNTNTNTYTDNTYTDNSFTYTKRDTDEESSHLRHKYGEYKNVLLSDKEYGSLKEKIPSDYEHKIEKLSSYMASAGKEYNNHYATICRWAQRDQEKTPTPKDEEPQGSFDTNDFFGAAVRRSLGDA